MHLLIVSPGLEYLLCNFPVKSAHSFCHGSVKVPATKTFLLQLSFLYFWSDRNVVSPMIVFVDQLELLVDPLRRLSPTHLIIFQCRGTCSSSFSVLLLNRVQRLEVGNHPPVSWHFARAPDQFPLFPRGVFRSVSMVRIPLSASGSDIFFSSLLVSLTLLSTSLPFSGLLFLRRIMSKFYLVAPSDKRFLNSFWRLNILL